MLARSRGLTAVAALTLALALPSPEMSLGAQAAAANPAKEKMSEEAFKNVQVLKGIPPAQFIEAMRFMAASLGVYCDHCHVTTNQGNWPMEKDDKEPKRTARKMISMTRAINADQFGGRTEVTCATCHVGRTKPIVIPPIAPIEAVQAPPAAAGAESLPPAGQILDRYFAALGGRDALAKTTSRKITGTLVGELGRKYPIEIVRKPPDKYALAITHPDGVELEGFNGRLAWGAVSGNHWTMEGSERDRLAHDAEFTNDLDLTSHFTRLQVAGKEKVGDREAYVVFATGTSDTQERFYFDVESGLLVRELLLTQTPLGRLPQQTEYDDYREVDGVKVPFTIRRMEINARWIEQYSEVQDNVPVDDARFDPPNDKK